MDWIAQTSGTIVDLNDVSFADAKHGWAVGEEGLILRTDDGGTTWTTQNSGTNKGLLGICAASPSFGCAVGYNGAILTTTNGGGTWHLAPPYYVQGNTLNLFAVHFVDSTHGWACGPYGSILRTADGGATWQALGCPIAQQVAAIHFVDASYGWAGGAGGAIIATRDGGLDWTLQNSGTSSAISGIRFTDRQHGYAVDLDGAVWSTSDGGQQWQPSRARPSWSETALALDVVGSQGCCVVGFGGLLAWTDDGLTWNTDATGSTSRLQGVDFVDASHGWIVGTGGTILHCGKAEAGTSVHRPSWRHDVAIDPMALLLPNSVYVKWVEGHHPHTPEQFERFVRGLRPSERRLVAKRAADLHAFSADIARLLSGPSRTL